MAAVAAVLLAGAGVVVGGAAPAWACSCQADVVVADQLAASDAAFVGVYLGHDEPVVVGGLLNSGQPVLFHFDVERAVKGDVAGRVSVQAALSGASCGLELDVGERTGLLLRRQGDTWRSSLCEQTAPDELLAAAPALAPVPADGNTVFAAVAIGAALLFAGLAWLLTRRRAERRTTP